MPEMKKYSEWGMASRSLILLVACSAIPSSGVTAETTPGNLPLNLLPWPKSVNVESGEVRIGSESRILVASPELRPLANILGEELRLLSGLNLKVSDGSSHDGDIVLKINNQLKAGDDILMVQKLQRSDTRLTVPSQSLRRRPLLNRSFSMSRQLLWLVGSTARIWVGVT